MWSILFLFCSLALPLSGSFEAAAPRQRTTQRRQTEKLDRGLVAVHFESGKVFIGWRLLGTDPDVISFNFYRATSALPGPSLRRTSVRLNSQALVEATSFVDIRADLTRANFYFVRAVVNGQEQKASAGFWLPANDPRNNTN
jgi:rhamnogalacturonan endolyase